MTRRRRGLTWQELLKRASALPGIEQRPCYGTPGIYVRKRILARLREDGETVAIRIDPFDRDVLLEADPAAFYLTDHYRPYPMVVMRLAKVVPSVAMELLEQAWLRAAPKRLVQERSAAEGVEPSTRVPTRRPEGRSGTNRRRGARR